MCCSYPIQFAKRDRGQGFSSHEAPEAGTVAALRGWRIAEVGPSGEAPITPPACKLQARQRIYPPWIQTATIRLEFTPSSFQTLTPPAVYPQRPADSRRSILHFHASSLPPTHSSGYLSDLYVPCSAFGVSVRSIDRSTGVATTGSRSPTAFHDFAVTYDNGLSTTACSLWNSAGFIADRNCSPSLYVLA
jgi:hypothetical protein